MTDNQTIDRRVNQTLAAAGIDIVEWSETTIPLDESGYGSGQHVLVVLAAAKKTTLQKYVAANKYRRTHEGDRPGQVFATGLKCLGYVKGDFNRWQAICISSTYWDI